MDKKISLDDLRSELLGKDFFFNTPFGSRLLTYADYTASGRSLKFIEKYLIEIQRRYANTHTEDDFTGKYMTNLLHQSEHLIKKSINAEQNCCIIETGSGSTGAISKMQELLGVYIPAVTKKKILQQGKNNPAIMKNLEEIKPIVFISPIEHHSNEIMWREALVDAVVIALTPDGYFDIDDLERKVSDPQFDDRVKIGSFSACSNITGLKTPVYEIARIMHKYGGLACFDFAAGSPYERIDMNLDSESYFDAVYLSPHKYLGGPGSTGILVFNQKLYDISLPPTFSGGGTVDFVSPDSIIYSSNIETREKPGTPGILQTIKAGLAISLKDSIGNDVIEQKELEYTTKALERLEKHPNISILGPLDPTKRVGIVSFMTKHGEKKLHPQFVTRLLNDLFGIQSRAGCMCAGSYGHRLLQISHEESEKFKKIVAKGKLGIKPGWARVNFHYILSEIEFEYMCKAIEFIASNGYKFIPDYEFDFHTGGWDHLNFEDEHLHAVPNIETALKLGSGDCFAEEDIDRKVLFEKYLQDAEKIAHDMPSEYKYSQFKDPNAEKLRWFNFVHIRNE
ncbi:MAG: aminotransferase class V-fold PLP-dependent enzyme [Promethearchaeota archaeon]